MCVISLCTTRLINTVFHVYIGKILIMANNFAGFTGVDQPYECPEQPDLVVKTEDTTIEESCMQVVKLLQRHVKLIEFFLPNVIS